MTSTPPRWSLNARLAQRASRIGLACVLGLVPPTASLAQATPASEEVRVATSADDAEQKPGSGVSTTSSDLELVFDSGEQTVGMRFAGLSVPQGAAITRAWVQFQVDESSSGAVALEIRGEASDDALTFSSAADVLSRVPTSAVVAWSPADWPSTGVQGPDQRTPDIAAIVQEIVDRQGWDLGHSLAILITGSGERVAESYDGASNGAPLLHLEYVLSDQDAPVVDAGPDQQIVLPEEALLDGMVSDDGLPVPPGAVTTSWSLISGPGTVDFSDPADLAAIASFSLPGTYVLRLTASDGEKASTDEVQITVVSSLSAPIVSSFSPASGQVASVVSIVGSHFSGAEEVSLGGVSASFWIESDGLLHATVPAAATTGPVVVTNASGSGVAGPDFSVAGSPPVLVGAGDISDCSGHADDTADLLDGIAGTVFTAGDHAYHDGTAAEFADCYDPTWGRHRARTRPAPGAVDYDTADATAYYDYFGPAAGRPDEGYYSYDLGSWHVVALNSECSEVGGCDEDSPQGQWLREDLIRNPSTCTLAYWAAPRFSSGDRHGSNTAYTDFWRILYDAGADVVVNGHDHIYERFAPQRWDGTADPQGIREFVVGTGGYSLYGVISTEPNSEVHDVASHGVLKLTLGESSYDWEFIPIPGRTFTDSGSDDCVDVNQIPVVDAGPDRVAPWPGSVALAGEAIDDGLPAGSLTVSWSQVSGPGTATFDDASSPVTTVSFSEPGVYGLRLTADDGEEVASDEVSIVAVEQGTEIEEVVVQIVSGNDDVEESVANGSMYRDSSDLELVDDFSTVGGSQLVGLRFRGVAVPHGMTVLNATVQFQVDEESLDPTTLTIRGEASDDAAAFGTGDGDLSSRNPTGESVAWAPAPWPSTGAAGGDQETPDLSAVVQEIVDRSGWSSGNALALLIEGSGRRTAESYDGDASGAATLRIRYSTATSPIDVPDVLGESQSVAEADLQAAGLSLGGVTSQSSETVAAGIVLSQDPAACAACAFSGDPVDLVVSSGPPTHDVPDVVGLDQAAAEADLLAAELSLGSVTSQSSQTVAAGVVLSQDPAACTFCASPGDPVDLVVSSGPAPIDVPDVVGLDQTTAAAELLGAGLSLGNVTRQPSETVAAGLVLDQDPASCTACAAPGGSVDLVVSSGPVPIDVPDVVGSDETLAEATLLAAGLSVGGVTGEYSETVAAGIVLSQAPTACLACAFSGDPIDLLVSSGPAPIDVPGVAGLDEATAESILVGAGLSVGSVSSQSSTTVAEGLVISHDPEACLTCALPGDPVDLVISSGPPNVLPDVTITAPADDANVVTDTLVTFNATAVDEEEGDVAASLVWTSNKNGVLGTGPSITATLSPGRHTITATATDSRGGSGSDAISVHARKPR